MSDKTSVVPLKALLFSFHGANMIIISFLPLYLQHKGLDGQQIGWVLAIGPMMAIFSQPFWGYMSDKYQTVKRILIICVIGLLIFSFIFMQMSTLPLLLLFGAIFFFFTAPIGALGDSLSQRRSEDLGVSFGSIRTWGSIGFALSSLVIGEYLQAVGVEYMIWPYLILGGVVLAVCFKLTDVKVNAKRIQLSDVKLLIKNHPFTIFLAMIMLITITHRANDSFMGIYISQLGGDERLIGIAWFVGVASEALVFAFAGHWFKKYHPLIFIIAAGVLYSVRWFGYAIFDEPIYIVILQFLHGLTFGVFYLTAFSYVSRLIPKILQSTGHLVFVSVFFGLSGIIGSLIGGAVIDSMGGSYLYMILGTMSLVGTILLTLYHLLPFGK
ncbi:MFS transporter [Aquibacillus koreensis]|uniref:MFS transporter n=1 Tax=Aquibacillus koreensis TaxID=279446 RepID=A0A9X4AK95_9BACI|nr:MFS transporter [Aquibacillus koreensis]MCT2537741.1 MFS transporter [Aquibacillus koreensis]MDC3421225.1 MFS transporter [Aquibacillus koreensis]